VGSNLFCNHTSVEQNGTTAKRESDLFNHECDYRPNWTTRSRQLIITITISEKKCILFCERAFYTNYLKSGKILLAETLSYVTNSSVLENPCLVG